MRRDEKLDLIALRQSVKSAEEEPKGTGMLMHFGLFEKQCCVAKLRSKTKNRKGIPEAISVIVDVDRMLRQRC